MPCRDESSDSYASKQVDELKKRLDKVTQLLCYVCGELRWESDIQLDERVTAWFKKHTQDDELRVSTSMDKYLAVGWQHSPEKLAEKFIDDALKVHPVSRWHRNWFETMARKAFQRKQAKQTDKDKKEHLVKNALSKLSNAERKALGL